MTPLYRFMLLSGALLSLSPLAACSTGAAVDQDGMSMMKQHLSQSYFINAANVVVENKYNPLANPKDVSSTLPTPLDKAVKQYAEARFRPAGSQGIFHYVIEDASVFRESLPSAVNIGQFLGLGDQDRYTASVKVGMFREGIDSGIGAKGYEIKSERTLTMQSDVSLDERDQRLNAFVTDLLNDLDRNATDNIANTLKLSAPQGDLAPSPGPYPPIPVEQRPIR